MRCQYKTHDARRAISLADDQACIQRGWSQAGAYVLIAVTTSELLLRTGTTSNDRNDGCD
jgi:hypothetical protein